MKLLVNTGQGLTIQAEGETTKDLFKQIALVQKTFEDNVCGLCESRNLQYVFREAKGYEFYELRCKDCRGKLSFGNPKADEGNLYPKRFKTDDKGNALKDENDRAIPLGSKKNGWVKWNPEEQREE